ncbi:MAG: hypothetical protein ACRBBW_14420 [Cellvibrionaceae bacterium]
MMNLKTLLTVAVAAALPVSSAFADTKNDAQAALNALNGSVASAELTLAVVDAEQAIRTVEAQEAVNMLTASLAEADLSIALADANDAIRFGQGQDAVNMLAASIAGAEVSIALASANETINGVSDMQMLAELDTVLDGKDADSASDLIMAVVAERPMLAAAVQDMAVGAGYNEAMVASSVFGGLGDLPATAAGQ